jgi:hypothetical protein
MINELLRSLLGPDDDGRGFTEAVLLRAAGALHRRRLAAEAAIAEVPPFGWLERWARPWLVAALILLAAAALVPAQWNEAPPAGITAAADTDAMVAAMLPVDMTVAIATENR